jgi:cell division protein FtsW
MHIKGDTAFLVSVIALAVVGLVIFSSASLGLLARDGVDYKGVLLTQLVLGFGLGFVLMAVMYRIPYQVWQKYAFYIFIAAWILTALVFIPGIGFSHGGATRWIDLGFITFQPSELLKIAFVIYFATWLSGIREDVKTWQWGFLPLAVLIGICGLLLLFQPDTDSFVLIALTGAVMFFAAGARLTHIAIMGAGGVVMLAGLIIMRPYLLQRILTFVNPSADSLTSSYQLQQSLIAIGSGGMFGRGFGQSIQKFNFLPEPIGDSIFAVAAEEFGFVGAALLVLLFVIIFMIITQSLLNMGAMLGVVPLAGMPLIFISHGGTALMLNLAQIGIVLNISKHMRKIPTPKDNRLSI